VVTPWTRLRHASSGNWRAMQQRNRRPWHCHGTSGGTVVAPVQGDIGRVTKQSSDKRSAFKKNVGQSDQPEIDRRGQRQGFRCRGVRSCSAAALSRAALRIGSVQRLVTLGTQRGRWRSVCGDASWTGQWEIGHVPRFVTPGLHIIGRSSPPRTLSERYWNALSLSRTCARRARSTLRTLSERFLVRVGDVTPVLDAGRTARSLSAFAPGRVLALRFGRLSHQLGGFDTQRFSELARGVEACAAAGLKTSHCPQADARGLGELVLHQRTADAPGPKRGECYGCCARCHWTGERTGRIEIRGVDSHSNLSVLDISRTSIRHLCATIRFARSFDSVCKNPALRTYVLVIWRLKGGCG
jgi:hypothetical protein